ncbi:Hydroxyacid oxidase 1 [Holothuria leucospilota]|uniref:(S)-2-hydroxy-acid oxidase n=1 Tax=Holothuria leucospilota TaxID=206669 RepID=A0A9Q1BIQ9_HOLLE|nr:Hydroxyacid oxidase 1 [Holothuria leucospilota]
MPTGGVSCVADFEKLIEGKIPEFLADYYATGAGDEQTLVDSKRAFQRFRLRPRVLSSETEIDVSTHLQGQPVSFPLGIAPTGYQGACHPDGDKATARAADRAGIIMIVSTYSFMTIEEIATAAPKALLWMQIYPFRDRRNTVDMIKRAEQSGFKGIVVTVDSPAAGLFTRSFRSGDEVKKHFGDQKPRGVFFIYHSVVNFQGGTEEILRAKSTGDEYLYTYAKNQSSSAATWEDIAWIKSITRLPIILKGILTAESAREAVACRVQGIIVSAHGGRQLDGVLAPIEALPEVVNVVRGSGVEVYMDGGVRSGRDIFKALAIGAKAVFIGRPAIWGLVYNGTDGVTEVLDMLKHEFVNTMSLVGCNRLEDINQSFVQHESQLVCKL